MKPKAPLPPTRDPKTEALKAARLARDAAQPKPISRITHRLEIVGLSNGDIRITKDRAQRRPVPGKITARVAREQELLATIRDQIRTDDSDVITEARLYMAMYDLTRCSWRSLACDIAGELLFGTASSSVWPSPSAKASASICAPTARPLSSAG